MKGNDKEMGIAGRPLSSAETTSPNGIRRRQSGASGRATPEQHETHDSQGGDILALLDARMRMIADEVVAASGEARQLPHPDAAAEEVRARITRIMAKEFISVMEAALLLSCSDGHVRNLVKKAKKGEARHPVPFRDLDGVVVFKLDKLLAWSEQPKTGLKALPLSEVADTLPTAPSWAATPGKGQV